jgi:hypothetical protein
VWVQKIIDERPQSFSPIQSARFTSPPDSYPIHSGGNALTKNLLRAGIVWNELRVQPNNRDPRAMEVETADTNSEPFVGQSPAYFGFNFFSIGSPEFLVRVHDVLSASRQVSSIHTLFLRYYLKILFCKN